MDTVDIDEVLLLTCFITPGRVHCYSGRLAFEKEEVTVPGWQRRWLMLLSKS